MSIFHTDIETFTNKLCSHPDYGYLDVELNFVGSHGAATRYVYHDRKGIVVSDSPSIGITQQEAIDAINYAIRVKTL